jgi:hypothetical protein
MESVEGSLRELGKYDLRKIAVISHDYLTKGSIAPHYQEGMRPMHNEEQTLTVLDRLAQHDAQVECFYGHIGFEYAASTTQFVHRGKRFVAHHIDEKGGGLTPLVFKEG